MIEEAAQPALKADPDTPRSVGASRASRPLRRWRIILSGAVVFILLAAAVGYLLIVHAIRARLVSLVRQNLDGELQGASVYWRPPYGLIVRDARVVRGDGRGGQVELLHVDRLEIKLAGLPHGQGPVVIESLTAEGPSLHLIKTEQEAGPEPPPGAAGPAAPPVSAAKWSDKVRVNHLRIEGASMFYQDRNRPGVPELALQNVNLQAGPVTAPGGAQVFEISAHDALTDLHARGAIEPDDLLVTVDDIGLEVRLNPAATQTPLPQPLSDWLRRFNVGGALSLHGRGRVPARSPQLSTFDGTLEVTDASANWPGSPGPVYNANVKLLCDSTPAPTTRPSGASPAEPRLHVRLAAGNASFDGVSLQADSGEFLADPDAGTWKVSQLAGHVIGAVNATRNSAEPSPVGQEGPAAHPGRHAPAWSDRQTTSDGSLAATNPTTAPDEPPLRGRVDFTATAAGPLQPSNGPSNPSAMHYEVLAFPRDMALKLASFPLPIDHITGMIRADNAAVSFRSMAGAYGGDEILLDNARIPMPEDIAQLWALEVRVEELAGSITCYQPGPVYPSDIQDIFADLRPEGTFTIGNGRLTINTGSPQPGKPKPKGDFALDVSSDGSASFSVTDHRIPITGVRGNASLGSLGIVVGTNVEKKSIVTGQSLQGTVSLHMTIAPRSDSQPAHFQGEVWAQGINVAMLCNVFDMRDGAVSKTGGKGSLHGTFSVDGKGGRYPPAQTLRAAGEAEILGADYWEDPIVSLIAGSVESKAHPPKSKKEPGVCDAAAVFHIADRVITLDKAALNSPSLGIAGLGTITFDQQLDLDVVATPIGDLKASLKQSAGPVIGEVAGDVAGLVQGAIRSAAGALLYQYHITGPGNHPTKQIIAAPAISDAGALLFGRMAELKNGELLNAVKAGAAEKQRTPTSEKGNTTVKKKE